jgi:hypothetical protein
LQINLNVLPGGLFFQRRGGGSASPLPHSGKLGKIPGSPRRERRHADPPTCRWPGKARELGKTIESAMALAKRDVVESEYLPAFLLIASPQDSDYYQKRQNLSFREEER